MHACSLSSSGAEGDESGISAFAIEKIRIYDKRVEAPDYYDTFGEFSYSYHYGDMYSPYIKQEEPIKVECQHFIDCIKTGEKPESSGFEGLQVVQILEAASKSLKQDGIQISIDDFSDLETIIFQKQYGEYN